jgi:hypothetical protein
LNFLKDWLTKHIGGEKQTGGGHAVSQKAAKFEPVHGSQLMSTRDGTCAALP